MFVVSVIIPTYNRAGIIGGAIESVLAQSFTDWELIVVDDGSQDNTQAVVTGYGDDRIRYIYQQNSKSPGARNTGIRASRGRYVAFLDSDDRFLPAKLQRQVEAMEQEPNLGLVATGWQEINADHTPRRTLTPWQAKAELNLQTLLYNCMFPPSAAMVKRAWLLRVDMFDAEQYYVEDWDLWLRLAYAGCPMAWVKEPAWLRVIHPPERQGDEGQAGSRARNTDRMIAGTMRLLAKFFAQPDLPPQIRDQQDRAYARAHVDALVRAFGTGLPVEGEKHLAQAIRLDPGLLAGQPPAVLNALASTALTHLVDDVDRYVADLCQALPRIAPKLARSPRQFKAMIKAAGAFEDVANNRRRQARLKAAGALMADPTWFRNRGLLSILLKP